MAPLTSGAFVAFFTCLWGFVLAAGLIKITAEPGQTVTLPCQDDSYTYISAVQWSRTDLLPKWIFFYRDQHSDPENQHPLLKNRVELKDRQLSNGDASLLLKNVIVNDTGTYECHVTQTGAMSTERISVIVLNVQVDPDSDRERLLLRIMLFIVVGSPYVISTLQVVSLCRKRNAGNNSSVSVIESPPSQHQESLDEQGDVIAQHHSSDLD